MSRAVWKFGGEALADGVAVARVARLVAEHGGDPPPVVVVSAHSGVTDQLEAAARRAAAGEVGLAELRLRHRSLLAQLGLPGEPFDRFWRELATLLEHLRGHGAVEPAELDLCLSFGERLSARIVARALEREGVHATPVDAWDLGLVTDSRHGCARPLAGIGAGLRAALAQVPGVPVVTGFVAKDAIGRATTLGRNGSDLTAAVLAEALGARELVLWKAVGGILSADPRLVPLARVLDEVTYAEASELAFQGARVLHPASIAPVVRAGIPVRVRAVGAPASGGTELVPERERVAPVSVASRAEVLGIELDVTSPERRGALTARLFATLDDHGVTAVWIATEGERVRALVEPGPGAVAALAELGPAARAERGLASLALVGQGVGGLSELGARALATLAAAGIGVLASSGSGRAASQVFVVRGDDLARAVRALHDELVAPVPALGASR